MKYGQEPGVPISWLIEMHAASLSQTLSQAETHPCIKGKSTEYFSPAVPIFFHVVFFD